MSHRAVFLDRDGTINREVEYLQNIEQFEPIPGAVRGIRLLRAAGYRVVIVTNQSGVARGYFSERELNRIQNLIAWKLQDAGAPVDATYYCPHHPEHGNGRYRRRCDCRKPRPGMLLQAARALRLDLAASFMVGDKLIDLEAGRAAGCASVLVRTGYGRRHEQRLKQAGLRPDHIADNLLKASEWILQQETDGLAATEGSAPFGRG